MESLIERIKGVIKDPDLFRLFENSYPNTLDTMIKWRGYAKEEGSEDQVPLENATTSEELTYVITGDVRSISFWIWNIAPFVSNLAPSNTVLEILT
jgi:meiotically up-regulated gene 157 (Mug157) protein